MGNYSQYKSNTRTLNRTNHSKNTVICDRKFCNEFELTIFNGLIDIINTEVLLAFINNFLLCNNKYFAKCTV